MVRLSSRTLIAWAASIALGTLAWGQAQTAPAQAPAPGQAAQTPVAPSGITGTWQGTLHAPGGHDLRTVLKITKDDKGALHAMFYSIDQSGQGIATSSISFDDGTLKYGIEFIGLSFEGKMSADGNSISGTSKQGDNSIPLVFERATPETEWAMPAPPPKIPPMAADAHPSFEVATIKPTKPDEQRTYLIWRGGEMQVVNFSLSSLVKFAYDLQDKQIIGAPDWMSSEKVDIEAKPDTPGQPSGAQLKEMVQKLLADRFALKFHNDQREMAAYVLTVGKDGPKMKQNTDNPNGLPGLFFGPIGTLHVMNATMQNFTSLMQSAVLDRPVVDSTGLKGRWDFTLKWTPDESQFTNAGFKVPPPSADDANAAPPLFTAIQEQLDLKLEAQKTQVPVLVIDHIDHPSPN
ncbi:MAG TPA: TIGR03435 family protein [Acidobacteriaceae bacterium]|nr:TIGR03435 family protein [Acidobacteriaceae bacterium]